MAVVALCSAKGSPGVTTAALALTLTWPGRCVLAECDPAGGSVQAGYLAGTLPTDRGVWELAVAVLRGEDLASAWWGQLIDLDPPRRRRLLLPGITDPAQSGVLRPVWGRLGEFFTSLEHTDPGYDVIVDCGRLAAPNTPWPLLSAADLVLLVLPGTLPGLSAATPAVGQLRAHLRGRDPGGCGLRVLLCGAGDESSWTVTGWLDTPVIAELPQDRRTARALCRGGRVRAGAPLMHAVTLAGQVITRQTARCRRLRADPARVGMVTNER
jgi:hypothetical protein